MYVCVCVHVCVYVIVNSYVRKRLPKRRHAISNHTHVYVCIYKDYLYVYQIYYWSKGNRRIYSKHSRYQQRCVCKL